MIYHRANWYEIKTEYFYIWYQKRHEGINNPAVYDKFYIFKEHDIEKYSIKTNDSNKNYDDDEIVAGIFETFEAAAVALKILTSTTGDSK